MKKNKILLTVFLIFMAVILYITYDMSSKTTKPWEKKNKGNQVIKKD